MAKKKKKRKKPLNYLLLVPLVGVIVLLFFFNLNIYRQRQETRTHLERIKAELNTLSQERESFKEEFKKEEIEEEIERIAREQLLLRKEGENVIVISRENEEGEDIEEDHLEEEEGLLERTINLFPW